MKTEKKKKKKKDWKKKERTKGFYHFPDDSHAFPIFSAGLLPPKKYTKMYYDDVTQPT